jgi:hypothetical protein
MRALFGVVAVLLAMISLAAPVLAAKKQTKKVDPFARMQPMRVTLARDADPACLPACPEWLAADGDIVAGSPAEFRRAIKALGTRKLPVMINSRGGSVEASIVIARLLRKAGLDVGVARTDFAPCAPSQKCRGGKPADGASARLREDFAVCASSCAFILAGGQRRIAAAGSNVGVHQIKAFRTLIKVRRTYRVQTRLVRGRPIEVSRKLINEKQVSSRTTEAAVTDRYYAPIGLFLKEMNVDASLITFIRDTPNESIHWLTPTERQTTRLATETASVRVLLSPSKAKKAAILTPLSVVGAATVTGSTIFKRIELKLEREPGDVIVTARVQDAAGQNLFVESIKARIGVYGLGLEAINTSSAAAERRMEYAIRLPVQGFCPDAAHEFLKIELLPTGAVTGGSTAQISLLTSGWAAPFVRQVCAAASQTAKNP